MLSALLLAALSLPAHTTPQDDLHRQFDFWIGEWSVQNRHIQPDGSWKEGDVTRARITPVCGGMAILEEWAGPFRGSFMNGFSLRSWNEPQARWDLVLFWTTDGNASFGKMGGTFRHGRGEFVAPASGQSRTRYTFSDALADTVRWDSARTKDSGASWSTDWIMEFSRTRAAREVTQDELFATAWTKGKLSPYPQARVLDWMLGTWTGTASTADGEQLEARLRCKTLDKDCLILDLLETRAAGDEAWTSRLFVRGFSSAKQRWEAWQVSSCNSTLEPLHMTRDGEVFLFEGSQPGSLSSEALVAQDDERLVIETNLLGTRCRGSAEIVVVELERVPRAR